MVLSDRTKTAATIPQDVAHDAIKLGLENRKGEMLVEKISKSESHGISSFPNRQGWVAYKCVRPASKLTDQRLSRKQQLLETSLVKAWTWSLQRKSFKHYYKWNCFNKTSQRLEENQFPTPQKTNMEPKHDGVEYV